MLSCFIASSVHSNMLKVVKLRLYPNTEQKQSLEQSFGNCRWLYNYCLNLMNQTYSDTGKGLSGYEVKKLIPQLKKEHEWLSLAYSSCLQQVCLNLGVAFNNFFAITSPILGLTLFVKSGTLGILMPEWRTYL